MFALPEQTLAEARADAEAALAAGTTHLSFYHLTLEPNTHFYRHPPALPEEDAAAAMQDAIGAALAARGYVHYETSAWAKPGCECRHNLNYWRFGDYLGIGAGAHGKVSFPDRVVRTARWKQPREYLQRVAEGRPAQELHEVGRDDLVFEFMMNALRLTDGFPVASFVERTGLQIAVAERALREAEARGLIARDHERIRPTDLGQRFLNDLLQLFLPLKSG
jgi:oxygen-independent coproporphyrinogen-3 oxidase